MSRLNCAIGKDYAPASFKGVSFYCSEADIEGGRRGAEGEFPFGENTAYADLGRKINVYHLTAYFREDDHVSDSQALFSACESPGPGLLVHPTRGSIMAACRSVKLRDAIEESAGETTAEMEFVEANSVSSLISGSLFGIISSSLSVASQEVFLSDYQPASIAQPWRTEIVNKAQILVDSVATITMQTLPANSSTQAWRNVLRMQEIAKDDALAMYGTNIDSALSYGFKTILANVKNQTTKFKLMRKLANVAVGSTNLESEEAVLSRHRILAGIGMSEAAMGQTYNYVNEALKAKETTNVVLEDEAKIAYDNCDNPLFLELRKYTIEFSKMMDDLAYRLPGLVAVDFMGSVHPLVAAYAIYRDSKRHRDLEQRNVMDGNGKIGALVVGVTPA